MPDAPSQIRPVTPGDIPRWEALSASYDAHVLALVGSLDTWYGAVAGDGSLAFASYMQGKIAKGEAFMAVDTGGLCLGIIAFSRHSNAITFFGVATSADLPAVGGALIAHALAHLDASRGIRAQVIASPSARIARHRELFTALGFAPAGKATENGVPVDVFIKAP